MTAAGRRTPAGCGCFWRKRASRCRWNRSTSGRSRKSREAFTAINPLQRVPVLVLDDGTVITESIAICRYFEALHPEPPLFGRGALEIAQVEMWNRRLELHLLFPISHVFRNSHPAMAKMEIPQVPAWAEANKPRIEDFLGIFDRELARPPVRRRRPLQCRRYHRHDRHRLHEAGEACGAGGVRQCAPLARRGVGTAERGRMSMRLTIVGSGDAFGSGGRFNTCFWLETAKATLAGRLRSVLAGGAQGARARPRQCRRHHPLAPAWRPFRRAAVPAHRRATGHAARASAHHRRAARLAGADRGRDRELLSACADQQVAVSVRDRGDRAGTAGGDSRPRAADGRGGAPVGRAVDRAADFRRRRGCSPIPATPNGPMRSSASPTAPIFSLWNATVTPGCSKAT